MTYCILYRQKVLVNTDPQQRCYDGCHFSSEIQWTAWGVLESGWTQEVADQRLKFWRGLNEYAVTERGKAALKEFKVEATI